MVILYFVICFTGYKGTSTLRLKESRRRDRFYSDLTKIENQLSKILMKIKVSFKDVVTFKVRVFNRRFLWECEYLYLKCHNLLSIWLDMSFNILCVLIPCLILRMLRAPMESELRGVILAFYSERFST